MPKLKSVQSETGSDLFKFANSCVNKKLTLPVSISTEGIVRIINNSQNQPNNETGIRARVQAYATEKELEVEEVNTLIQNTVKAKVDRWTLNDVIRVNAAAKLAFS